MPDSQIAKEPNLKPIFKQNFLFYPPINKPSNNFKHFATNLQMAKMQEAPDILTTFFFKK